MQKPFAAAIALTALLLAALLLVARNPSGSAPAEGPTAATSASEAPATAPTTQATARPGNSTGAAGVPMAVEPNAAARLQRLYQARSLDELLAAAEQLPADDPDVGWELDIANGQCIHRGHDAAAAFTSLTADGILPDDAETRERYFDWWARRDQYCGDSTLRLAAAVERSRAARAQSNDDAFERLTHELDALEAQIAAAGVKDGELPPLDDEARRALVAVLASTSSSYRFLIAADRLARFESGPFERRTAGFTHVGDAALRYQLLTAAVELARCEWTSGCHEASLWMLGACGAVQYCRGGWNYPNYLSRRFGADDLERIRALAARLNRLRTTGHGRG